MYNGIIFDLDGVICSTDQYHYQAWKRLADELDIYFDQKINCRLRGVSRMDSLNIVLERADRSFSLEERTALAEQKNVYYQELLAQMSPADLPSEVCETLALLRQRGQKLAIGSSSKNAGIILSRIGLGDFFDAVSDGNGLSHSKPDPEVFLKAAAMLKEPPCRCLVVEDATAGIEAALRGGFKCAGLGDAGKHPSVIYPISRFADLLDIVCAERQ